jgi:hypothetical protein
LHLMVELSVELIAGCDLADVMVVKPSGATTPVADDPLAVAIDRAQVEADEGPCLHVALDAMRWCGPTISARTFGGRASVRRWSLSGCDRRGLAGCISGRTVRIGPGP